MVRISEFQEVVPLLDDVKGKIRGSASLEEASNRVLNYLFEYFRESIVLTRIFATVPYGELPTVNQAFVDRLVIDKEVAQLLADDTHVLSLLASRGIKPAWNDRQQSVGHIGIPLASAEFVESIPMIARLLPEVGFELEWLESGSQGVDIETLAKLSGVFFVQDAASAVDRRGRKIISAQDFVHDNGVKTVFGMGGGFADSKTFLVVLFFCNETVEKSRSHQFLPLISTIKAATAEVIIQSSIFAEP